MTTIFADDNLHLDQFDRRPAPKKKPTTDCSTSHAVAVYRQHASQGRPRSSRSPRPTKGAAEGLRRRRIRCLDCARECICRPQRCCLWRALEPLLASPIGFLSRYRYTLLTCALLGALGWSCDPGELLGRDLPAVCLNMTPGRRHVESQGQEKKPQSRQGSRLYAPFGIQVRNRVLETRYPFQWALYHQQHHTIHVILTGTRTSGKGILGRAALYDADSSIRLIDNVSRIRMPLLT